MARALTRLHPAQRFMYDYGCFVSFWSNFELFMEAIIWCLGNDSPIDNCLRINKMTAGKKRDELRSLLESQGHTDIIAALDRVFCVAERNDWIHGHILNPNGDFSLLTRLRVRHNKGCIIVSNEQITPSETPFDEFYAAYGAFEHIVSNTLDVDVNVGNEYIRRLQTDQAQ